MRVEGDPVVFLGYWRNEEATAAKVRDGWLHTGDLAEVDDEGTYRSVGRVDDLISSGGYRIGPGEIEECLIRHPAVSIAAAIGTPDDVRGEVVKAFVVTVPGTPDSPELAAELQQLVRTRLAPYEVPREIEFVDRAAADRDGQDPPRRAAAARRRAPQRRLSAHGRKRAQSSSKPSPGASGATAVPSRKRRAAAAEQVRRVERVAARELGVERLDDRAGLQRREVDAHLRIDVAARRARPVPRRAPARGGPA